MYVNVMVMLAYVVWGNRVVIKLPCTPVCCWWWWLIHSSGSGVRTQWVERAGSMVSRHLRALSFPACLHKATNRSHLTTSPGSRWLLSNYIRWQNKHFWPPWLLTKWRDFTSTHRVSQCKRGCNVFPGLKHPWTWLFRIKPAVQFIHTYGYFLLWKRR